MAYLDDPKEKDKDKIRSLVDGESCHVNWFEEGGGEVSRIGDNLLLYEIPQFGGEGYLVGIYGLVLVDKIMDEIYSWT